MAQELALVPLPDDVDMCLAEAEELLFARDRITCALADRVGRVHRAGQAKQHGHASTRSWLRTSGGMTVGGAGRLLMLGAELPRLPVVREKFAAGELAAGVVEAICAAVAGLTDEQAALAEPILVELAGKAGAAEVAKAGRHLRAVLDPDGEERDEQADYERRFLRVRPGKGGGVEGEFYIPREPGARLMTLLHEYAKKKADGDDRTLTERQADALIAALLEQKIVTELLVVVSAESLPTDPENTDPATEDCTDPAADGTDDPAPAEADDSVSSSMSDPDHAGGTDAPGTPDEVDTAKAEAEAEADAGADRAAAAGTGCADGPGEEATADACATAESGLGDVREADAAPATGAFAAPATGFAPAPAPGSADATAGLRGEEPRGCGDGERGADERRPGECEPRDTISTAFTECDAAESTSSAEGDESAPATGGDGDRAATQTGSPHARQGASAWPADGGGHSDTAPADIASSGASPSQAAWPDPPPEDASARHTHAGSRPAGECRHGRGACRCGGDARCSHATQALGTAQGASGTMPGGPGPEPETSPGRASGTAPGAGRGTPGAAQGAAQGASPGAAPGAAPEASAGTPPGAFPGTGLGASLGPALGASLGMVPGLLLATGQVLPLSSVHRLARTSTLVRIVMNADGQVLDMGRKVRLATPAQRRAVFARYATCWIDGCPLSATMCQIDHADNWSTGGLTDLKLLGPACQFHNRDRYQHPERYTRRKEGTDRWAFTYHRLGTARRVRNESTT
ncbi:HNH endonuclease signature motif containing protein [Microbispora hainanensis]